MRPARPLKERMRSPLNRPLDYDDLRRAPILNVMRLAEYLGISTDLYPGELERGFRHRIICAIQRWEKRYRQGRCT